MSATCAPVGDRQSIHDLIRLLPGFSVRGFEQPQVLGRKQSVVGLGVVLRSRREATEAHEGHQQHGQTGSRFPSVAGHEGSLPPVIPGRVILAPRLNYTARMSSAFFDSVLSLIVSCLDGFAA